MNQKDIFWVVMMLAVFLFISNYKIGAEEVSSPVSQLEIELQKMETGDINQKQTLDFQYSNNSIRVQNLYYLMAEASKYIEVVNGNKLVFDLQDLESADPAVKYLVLALKQSDEELRKVATVKGVNLFQLKTTVKLVNLLDPYFRSLSGSQNTRFLGQSYSTKEPCNIWGAGKYLNEGSLKCAPQKKWKTFSKKKDAKNFLKNEGYKVAYNPIFDWPGSYSKCVDAYGCSSKTCWFRNHGKISKKGSKYVVYRQKDEPNPRSYEWQSIPAWPWEIFVIWWHTKC